MPFTLAHPAAVLPLMRTPFVAPALVAGAVAPDLPYYLRATGIPVSAQSWYEPFLNATTTHQLSAVLVVSLPAALLVHVTWVLVRRPAWAVLRLPHQDRPRARGNRPSAAAVATAWLLASLALGILTHLAWDSFTHGDGYVVTRWAPLRSESLGGLTWARALQHLSTTLGLAALGVALWRRRPARGVDHVTLRRATALAAATCVTGLVGALVATRQRWAGDPSDATSIEGVLRDAALGSGIAVVAAGALGAAAWWLAHAWRLVSTRSSAT